MMMMTMMAPEASCRLTILRPLLTLLLLLLFTATLFVENATLDMDQQEAEDDWQQAETSALYDELERALRRVEEQPLGLRRAHLTVPSRIRIRETNDDHDNYKLKSLVGLRRRIHRRRPELEAETDDNLRSGEDSRLELLDRRRPRTNFWRNDTLDAVHPTTTSKRSNLGGDNEKKAAAAANERMLAHKFFYIISPVSEQILPIQSEKVAQGFKSLLPLPGANYETGLRKLASSSDQRIKGAAQDNWLWSAPGAERELATGELLTVGCRTIKSSVQLTKDELEPISGQLVRHCTGRAELSACEGSCASSIEPSVKSASGFTKKCSCCNEGSFRRVQVRLDECSVPTTSGQQQQQQQQLVSAPESFMDVEVDEPIDCKCRPCDTLL